MVPDRKKVSPYFTWFIVHPIEFGMAELWFERLIVEDAGFDGWIGVIIAGGVVGILIWIIYSIMNRADRSVIDVHRQVFGKWVGGGFSLALLILFVLEGFSLLRGYAEVVQVWLFPDMGTWVIGLMVLVLVLYAAGGGFQVVVGVCFWGFLIPFVVLTPVLIFPVMYDHFNNVFPMFTHPLPDLLKTGKDMTLAYVGFEGLLVAYPFIQRPRSSQKWAHFGNLFTIIFYMAITIISLAYFNIRLIEQLIWPKLNLVQMTELPFLSAFSSVFISLWMFVILPNITYAVWTASRTAKELFHVEQRKSLWAILIVIFMGTFFFSGHTAIVQMNHFVSNYAFYFLLSYLPILWIAQRVRGGWTRKQQQIKLKG